MPWIARRIGVTARFGSALRGAKSGGRLIAQAPAPLAVNRSKSLPTASRSVA